LVAKNNEQAWRNKLCLAWPEALKITEWIRRSIESFFGWLLYLVILRWHRAIETWNLTLSSHTCH
jgi:hypothetical protein